MSNREALATFDKNPSQQLSTHPIALASARPHISARTTKRNPASALPSARPLASAILKKPATKRHPPLTPTQIEIFKGFDAYRNPENWHTESLKNDDSLYYIHNTTKLAATPSEYMQIANIHLGGGGGSRRRRSSHRKRKGYRKSKRVRHIRRKQTRRHRHRRSRHRQ
jgi:hypothetical protein